MIHSLSCVLKLPSVQHAYVTGQDKHCDVMFEAQCWDLGKAWVPTKLWYQLAVWLERSHLTFLAIVYFFFFFFLILLLLLFIYLFYFIILYWFCHTSTCIHHWCTRVPHPEPPSHFPPYTIPLGHPSAPAPSFLYPALNLDWQFVSYIIHVLFIFF